jgi:hypothetical protein
MEKKTLSTHSQRECAQRWDKGEKKQFIRFERKKGWLRRGCDWKGK